MISYTELRRQVDEKIKKDPKEERWSSVFLVVYLSIVVAAVIYFDR